MSKKSRKRNKKILGALAAGLGAMALMKGRGTAQGVSGSDKAKFTANDAYTGDVTGTKYPAANKVWKIKNSLASPKWNKMDTSEVDMNYVAPSTERYSKPDFGLGPWAAKKGGRAGHKSGGRVKGCGKAKRGFGRALKGGK
jgi:hypothetical protein